MRLYCIIQRGSQRGIKNKPKKAAAWENTEEETEKRVDDRRAVKTVEYGGVGVSSG